MVPRCGALVPALAALALAGGAATVALAGDQAWPSHCTIPTCIPLVGSTGGVVDPAGEVVFVLKDLANNPCVNNWLKLDFSACGGAVLGDPTFPGVTVDCVHHSVVTLTDVLGIARVRIAGAGAAGGAGSTAACVQISADAHYLRTVNVQLYDLDSANGVSGNDLSRWMADFFAPGNPVRSRSDYDCNGSVGGNDLALWLGVFNAGGSATSAQACP